MLSQGLGAVEDEAVAETNVAVAQTLQQRVEVDPEKTNRVDFNKDDLLSILRAAKRGHDDAQYRIGLLYATGTGGLLKDDVQDKYWTQKAARQGHEQALKRLHAHRAFWSTLPDLDSPARSITEYL
jgi:TPR repeat protein